MWLEIFNFIHFLGLAFGLGGATIASIISSKAKTDSEIRKAFWKIMPSISKLIGFGLFLLIVSGIFITSLIKWPLNKNLLIVKHILVAWILVIGIIISKRTKKRKDINGLSKINLILWYVVTLMSAFV
jgi:putative copper export protein